MGSVGVGVAGADPKAVGLAGRLLVGRSQELERLAEMIDQVGTRGGALVVRGEAGIGKSALLEAVAKRARDRGTVVVTTTGTQSEARLAFGGLHQLLLPFLDQVDHLPGPQRNALNVAFGVSEGDAPDVFLIGLATLGGLPIASRRHRCCSLSRMRIGSTRRLLKCWRSLRGDSRWSP